MQDPNRYDVIVAGGGLAGLSAAIQLAEKGYRVALIEKNYYPFHRVCGEYISEESRPFLERLGIPISSLQLPEIRRLRVTAPDGTALISDLDPGGFGISRYRLDALLASQAKLAGATVMEGVKVQDIRYRNGWMEIQVNGLLLESRLVLGCFGKRSSLDLKMNRSFALEKPGKLNNFIGIKYHIEWDDPEDLISLHNFKDGYCGISRIEDAQYCLCYLTTANNLGLSNNSIEQMEKTILSVNPFLEKLFRDAKKIRQEPLSIAQVSFASKSQVENHVLMVGDAAGLITPLCGNGMSMALHASCLAVQAALPFLEGVCSRTEMETLYAKNWRHSFSSRLRAGRMIQSFFGDPWLSKGLIFAGNKFPGFTRWLIGKTHGKNYV
jgi:flavin-dependent dehydrogenase